MKNQLIHSDSIISYYVDNIQEIHIEILLNYLKSEKENAEANRLALIKGIDVSQSTVDKALSYLEGALLFETKVKGTKKIYSLTENGKIICRKLVEKGLI